MIVNDSMSSSPKNDHPVFECFLEGSEVFTDISMKGDILADIPIIGMAFKVCKAVDAIRDRVLLAKLNQFVSGLGTLSEKQITKMKRKLSESPEQATKVGEILFLTLERMTDFQKAQVLAKIFLAYIDAVISSDELRRLAQAVDTAFFDDLRQFIEAKTFSEKCEEEWMQYLVASGFTRSEGGKTHEDVGRIFFVPSSLGEKLREIYGRVEPTC